MKTPLFVTEQDLCLSFLAFLDGQPWTVYREWANWDMLLVRNRDGFQIGLEAKLKLTPKVVAQALPSLGSAGRFGDGSGPDCRAILVPYDGLQHHMVGICKHLRLTVVTVHPTGDLEGGRRLSSRISPGLPAEAGDPIPGTNRAYPFSSAADWYEWCFATREVLPEKPPDVPVGVPAPVRLTPWKMKAIKLDIVLQRRGYVTPADFRHLDLSMTFFSQSHPPRLKRGKKRGEWVRGEEFPVFQAQHPDIWTHLDQTYDSWRPASVTA
jgi:hypothetical protein